MKQIPYVKTIMGDTETPITVFQKYVGNEIGFLLESKSKEKNRYSFIGKGDNCIIVANKDCVTVLKDNKKYVYQEKILDVLKDYMGNYKVSNNTKIPFMGGAVGIIGYDVALQYENIESKAKDVLNLPLSHFFFVTEFIAYDHDYGNILFIAIDTDDVDGEERANKQLEMMEKTLKKGTQIDDIYKDNTNIQSPISNMSKEQFIDKVEKAKKYIEDSEVAQVIISQRWMSKTTMHPFQLYRNLRSLNPSPYLFYFNFGDYQLVGSSPEMLVEMKAGSIYTCPIAGTKKRGNTDQEDIDLEKELLSDPKEIKEHIMLVELAKKDMEKVADKESIEVKDYMEIQKFSHVMHIASLVTGRKKDTVESYDVVNYFLPAGTLSGTPRVKAMEIIDELEDEKRGLYGGAVGYLGCNGDMDMCIAIRMMVIKDKKVYMQAGAGIVADSNSEKEYEECENKVNALMSALDVRR